MKDEIKKHLWKMLRKQIVHDDLAEEEWETENATEIWLRDESTQKLIEMLLEHIEKIDEIYRRRDELVREKEIVPPTPEEEEHPALRHLRECRNELWGYKMLLADIMGHVTTIKKIVEELRRRLHGELFMRYR